MSVIETVYARLYGIVPDTGFDFSRRIGEMLKNHSVNARFLFEPGRYDFYHYNALRIPYALSNTDWSEERKIAILLKDMKNIIFDGQNSSFVFHGQMLPIAADHCETLFIQNITIDWEIPLSAEGVVTANSGDAVDLTIDQNWFPCEVRDGELLFCVEDYETPLAPWAHSEFEADMGKMAINGGDVFRPASVQQVGDSLFRFTGDFRSCARLGNIIVLRHSQRLHSGLFAEKCRDVTFQNITVHNSGGLGILAQFCDTLCFYDVRFLPNRERGRCVLSGHDDGLQLSNNRGMIKVENCFFHGLMDDPINLHGTYLQAAEQVDDRTLRCRFMHGQSKGFYCWAEPGDELALTVSDSMTEFGAAVVERYELTGLDECILTLAEPLPDTLCPFVMENISNTAALICKNNVFGSCRGRGILVTTRRSVQIEYNLFESSGSAILIAGDAESWYESGPCRDVVIRRNIFTDHCATSVYGRDAGAISIHPEVRGNILTVHQNILVEENEFFAYRLPVLDAKCVSNISFLNNRVFRGARRPLTGDCSEVCQFDACHGVSMSGNQLIGWRRTE